MGLFGRSSAPPETLETVVGPSASLTGQLRSDGGVRIDGTFEGVIEVAGNVVIGEGARVVADITARNITVAGAVKGNIDGTGRLEILSGGEVYGDIMVAAVMIDEGGIFQGTSRMRGLEQRALAAPPEAGPRAAGAGELPAEDQALEVTARPAPDEEAEGSEVEDIEPIIPEVVIEDVAGEKEAATEGREEGATEEPEGTTPDPEKERKPSSKRRRRRGRDSHQK